jgi:hypothetical protein
MVMTYYGHNFLSSSRDTFLVANEVKVRRDIVKTKLTVDEELNSYFGCYF